MKWPGVNRALKCSLGEPKRLLFKKNNNNNQMVVYICITALWIPTQVNFSLHFLCKLITMSTIIINYKLPWKSTESLVKRFNKNNQFKRVKKKDKKRNLYFYRAQGTTEKPAIGFGTTCRWVYNEFES